MLLFKCLDPDADACKFNNNSMYAVILQFNKNVLFTQIALIFIPRGP